MRTVVAQADRARLYIQRATVGEGHIDRCGARVASLTEGALVLKQRRGPIVSPAKILREQKAVARVRDRAASHVAQDAGGGVVGRAITVGRVEIDEGGLQGGAAVHFQYPPLIEAQRG